MTNIVKIHLETPLSDIAKGVLRAAAQEIFGGPARWINSPAGPGVLNLDNDMLTEYPNAVGLLVVAMAYQTNTLEPFTPFDCDPNKVLNFDIESHSVDDRWRMDPEDFFRLGQYAWGPTGEVHLTRDISRLTGLIESAEGIVGHNIHSFDLSVLYGIDSTVPLELAMDNRVFDTMVFANHTFPAPETYVNRAGARRMNASKPEGALVWLSLDNLSYQMGLPGKIGDLKALANKYGGFGEIPLDDPLFVEYAIGDITALQDLSNGLLAVRTPTEYDWREQLNAAIDAQNARNGFRVNIPAATARRDELSARKETVLSELQEKYGLPTTGAQPWRSNVGKAAIWTALKDKGIEPQNIHGWAKTKTGYTLGGETLLEHTAGTEAEDLGSALAELMGQRTLSQLALDCVQPDGKVHPEITALQRSGRKSTTKPGLTVWTSRGKGAVEKSYFIPDSPDEVLFGFDFSQADARIVAALSGDEAFAERFAPGADAHEITGRVVFENYDDDPVHYRQEAKNLGHAYAYRARPKKLSMMSGQPMSVTEMFVEKMESAYGGVTTWQNKVAREGDRGFVVNDWGREMMVTRGKAFTQAPALYGQSGTRELMVDALIRMVYADIRLIRWLKAQIHDELIFSIPREHIDWAIPAIKGYMETTWQPREGGQPIHFPVGSSSPANNWMECAH